MDLLIQNIDTLVTCDDGDRVLHNKDLLIEDGVITAIGEGVEASVPTIDGTGFLVYPGLVNAHHHLYQIFTRNIEKIQGAELFEWLKFLYEKWKFIDEEAVRLSSLVGMGELVKYGCTTVFDHHYVFPDGAGDLIGAQLAAAKEMGVRFVASRGSMDLSVKDGGLPPDSVVQSVDEVLRDSRRLIEDFHDEKKYSMHQIVLAPCSPFSVSKEMMTESAALARSYGVRLHTHLAETKDEEEYTLEHFGMRPLDYMESLGWIGKDVWYAHGIHFNDKELDRLAETGTGVCHCPVSNMKLSSGVARVPEMLDRGIPLGLGVDGSASNDGSNLLEEIRTAYLLHRLVAGNRAPSGYEILKMATRGSASLLGREELGRLAIGAAGDLFMIRKNKLELVGALDDPKSLFGTVGYKQPVDYTIIGGKTVVEEGRLKGFDEDRLAISADKKARQILAK